MTKNNEYEYTYDILCVMILTQSKSSWSCVAMLFTLKKKSDISYMPEGFWVKVTDFTPAVENTSLVGTIYLPCYK